MRNICLRVFSGLSAAFSASRAWAQAERGGAVETVKSVAAAKADTARNLVDIAMEYGVKYSMQAVGGVIVLVLGWVVSKYVGGIVQRILGEKNVDVTVGKFIVSTVKLAIMAFALIVALGKFGIEIAPTTPSKRAAARYWFNSSNK